MLIAIDFQSETPLYWQLRTQIVEGIATGKLQPGEELPSVRQLAGDLGINMHTVNKTYNLLRQDGYITIHRQKGAVIAEVPPRDSEEYRQRLRAELQPLISEAFCRGVTSGEFLKECQVIFDQFGTKGRELE